VSDARLMQLGINDNEEEKLNNYLSNARGLQFEIQEQKSDNKM